jgi:hypothetical protein
MALSIFIKGTIISTFPIENIIQNTHFVKDYSYTFGIVAVVLKISVVISNFKTEHLLICLMKWQ